MPPERKLSAGPIAAVAMALAFTLFMHGAVPFVALPTLGQAVWTTGFAQSFANQSLLSIHAINFGAPAPAAIAFGLSGAFPASLLIRLGLHPADAYAAMMAGWLALAFFGAWRLARGWGVGPATAALGALAWLSPPMIGVHMGFSMLGLGMALLPFYFWVALCMLQATSAGRLGSAWPASLGFVLAAVVAVFMDGYTFVLFAVGTGLLWAHACVVDRVNLKRLLLVALPVMAAGAGAAYALYVAYIGRTRFADNSLDTIRGWGVDLTFLSIPPAGVHWLFDALGLSVVRSERAYFGDSSVWDTTFCLPLVLVGLWAFRRTRRRFALAPALLVIALFGFYMSLGPSLKIDSIKPAQLATETAMPAQYAVAPTGNAWLFEHVPGFGEMRASYRWAALGMFGLWALAMLWASQRNRRWPVPTLVLMALILMNLPHLRSGWRDHVAMRSMFFDIDAQLLTPLRGAMAPGERVAFLPYSNDFLVNYLAARTGVQAYNIGGDKNLMVARQQWPLGMQGFLFDRVDDNMPTAIASLLLDGEADVVVVPYFDALWAAHYFPCVREATHPMSGHTREIFRKIDGFGCPSDTRQQTAPLRARLRGIPELALVDGPLYSTVRLVPAMAEGSADRLKAQYFSKPAYPIAMSSRNPDAARLLKYGWLALEPTHVWSSPSAVIDLPRPARCEGKPCSVELRFTLLGATEKRPVTANFSFADGHATRRLSVTATDGSAKVASIPLGSGAVSRVTIAVPDAKSPAELGVAAGKEPLGIALTDLTLVDTAH